MQKHIKNLFIPHKGNGFKPNFLERFSMGVMLVLVLLSFAIANIQALLWIGSDWMVSTILPAVIIDLTNEERSDETISRLAHSVTLDRAAQMKADDMASHEYFAHFSPAGVSPWHWFDEASYDFIHAGENLAVHFTDSGDVVEAWMDSPAHKANILNGNFTEIGIGTAKGEYNGYPTIYVVQLFGTPRAVASVGEPETLAQATAADDITLEIASEPEQTEAETPSVAPASFETIENSAGAPVSEEGEEEPVPSEVNPADTVVIYSDLATTSRPGVARTADNGRGAPNDPTLSETNVIERSATQPSLWLEALYAILALIVVIALALSIAIEWRRQHPLQIAYAAGLLLIMGALYHMHVLLTGGVTIV